MKSPTARQIAALPIRLGTDGEIEIALVTSRETRRWIVPKGWPMKGLKPYEAAAVEAKEEAGLVGEIEKKKLGSYQYFKRRDQRFDLCEVDLYKLWVKTELEDYREKDQRTVRWVNRREALASIEEVGLRDLVERLGTAGSILPVKKRKKAATAEGEAGIADHAEATPRKKPKPVKAKRAPSSKSKRKRARSEPVETPAHAAN